MPRAHVIYDREQGRWLALALMPTGDPRITVTRWTYDKDKAFAFGSLKAASSRSKRATKTQRKGVTHI